MNHENGWMSSWMGEGVGLTGALLTYGGPYAGCDW